MSAINESTYTGERNSLGQPHGHGMKIFSDGRRYIGYFSEGKFHGKGEFTAPDGGKYKGEWQNGKFHGRGVFTSPDGTVYKGQWQNHQKHGFGTQTLSNGQVLYSGQWEHSKPVKKPLPTWDNYVTDINSILSDLTNLGEQYFVFALTELTNINESHERNFLFILFGVYTVTSILKCLTVNERVAILLSALVEIGELAAYLIVFNGVLYNENSLAASSSSTTTLFLSVTISCLLFQLVLLGINFSLIVPKSEKASSADYLHNTLESGITIAAIAPQFVILFLSPNSRFRDLYYEIYLTLTLFITALSYQWNMLPELVRKHLNDLNRLNERSDIQNSCATKIGYYWMKTLGLFSTADAYVGPLIIIVLSSLELHEGNLARFDFVWYLIWLGGNGILLLSNMYQLCKKYLCRSNGNKKVAPFQATRRGD